MQSTSIGTNRTRGGKTAPRTVRPVSSRIELTDTGCNSGAPATRARCARKVETVAPRRFGLECERHWIQMPFRPNENRTTAKRLDEWRAFSRFSFNRIPSSVLPSPQRANGRTTSRGRDIGKANHQPHLRRGIARVHHRKQNHPVVITGRYERLLDR